MNAATPPVSSRFKVFIIDECHLMRGETWATILSSTDNLSQHVVFVMITPDLDKLPRNQYHGPRDITSQRLRMVILQASWEKSVLKRVLSLIRLL